MRRSDAEQAGYRRGPRRKRRRASLLSWAALRAMTIGVTIGIVTFLLLSSVTMLSFYFYIQTSGRIVPGVTAGSIPLGNRTRAEAVALLEAEWSSQGSLTLTDGARTWQASPAQFGLAIDAPATVQRALNIGHGHGFVLDILEMTNTLLTGAPVTPVVALDAEQARSALEEWAESVNIPPQDATIRIEGAQVVAVPGQPGQSLDVEATLQALAADPDAALSGGVLPLLMVPVAPRIMDASGALAEAERILAAPLTVTAYDPITDEQLSWSELPEVVATWLGVESDESGVRVTVVEERLAAYIEGLGSDLGAGRRIDAGRSVEPLLGALRSGGPATLIVSHDPTLYTVQPGDTLIGIAWKVEMPFWRILDANPGLNADALTVGQSLVIPSRDDLLPLPVVPGKRIIVSIGQQRAWMVENGTTIKETVISTGIDRSPTQPGVFQVQTHELNAYASAWDLWMPHFLGIYEAWPGFMNGFHGLPSRNGGQLMWANSLGRPASYGCIILDLETAEWLYNWAEAGVVVEIIQ